MTTKHNDLATSSPTPLHTPLRWVVVGCGHIGRRHMEHISKHPQTQLVGMVDVLPAPECGAAQFAGVPFYPSVEDLLERGGDTFDVASICVPNGLHYPIALELIKAGKSLLIEKPAVLHPDEGEELIALAKAHGCHLYSVLQNRFTPVSAWLHQMIEEKRLGKLYQIELQCLWNRDERYYLPRRWHGDLKLDGGTLFTQYSHFLDLLIWCFGVPKVQGGSFYNYNHQTMVDFEDSGVVQLTFPQETTGLLTYSTAVYGTNCGVRLTVLGERGCIVLDGPFMNKLTHCVIDGYDRPDLGESEPGNAYGAYSGSAQNHHFVIDHTARALLGDPTAQAVEIEDALRVVRLIRNIYQYNPYLTDK